MTKRAVILIVDDEVSNIEILSAILEDEHEVCFASSGAEAIELAERLAPDLILLDVVMPGMDGYEVCRRLKANERLTDIPVIFTTALGEAADEVNGLKLGAIDYVTKPISPTVVQMRVRNHIEMKRMRDQLAQMAVTDALTGLSNRRGFEKALQDEVLRLSITGEDLSVLIVDIDFFKRYNDEYGHPEGDRCLAAVAAALNRAVRNAADLAVRYGGEEFACVLPATSHETAMVVAQTVRTRVAGLGIPHGQSDVAPHVTVSIGVATARCTRDADPQTWIKAADSQLYLAKAAGRNMVCGSIITDWNTASELAGIAGPRTTR